MQLNENTPQLCADFVLTRVAQSYATAKNIDNTTALRYIMDSKTFKLLQDPDSYLWLESDRYILDMLNAEQLGNEEFWLTI